MDRQEIGLYLSATVRQRRLHTDYFVENNLKSRPFTFSGFPAHQLITINWNRSVHCNWLKIRKVTAPESRKTLRLIKFIYSEKATKFCEIFPLLLTTVHTVRSKGKILQNFVAFSEYINFITFFDIISIIICPSLTVCSQK